MGLRDSDRIHTVPYYTVNNYMMRLEGKCQVFKPRLKGGKQNKKRGISYKYYNYFYH